MKFRLSLDLDNATFDPEFAVELARVLRVVADAVAGGSHGGQLQDENGNTVGIYSVKGKRK